MTVSITKPILTAFILAAFTLILSFHTSLPVHAVSYDTTDIIQPKINDVLGRDISQAAAGSPTTLKVGIENNEDIVRPFVLLVEVRDSNDRTTFLAWQSGSLSPLESSEVGVSWTPDSKGDYEVRAFAISNLQNPEVLSEVQSREIEVGDFIVLISPVVDDEAQEEPVEQDSTLATLQQHALKRINEDRSDFGLEPVELSDNKAAQIHAEDVLKTRIISHWMTNGEKPYMTYTRYGGLGAVGQNVGTSGDMEYYEDCTSGFYYCDETDPFKDIDRHQHNMMYEDKVCCDDGHRDNILDPHHTHVSIGIGYDDYGFVIVQNFEDNYIDFDERTITRDGENVVLKGSISSDATFSGIQIGYDETPTSAVYDKNRDNDFYDAGEIVAGVTDGDSYFEDIETISANRWIVSGNEIDIAFDLEPILDKRGVYTIWTFLEDEDGRPFPVTCYSVVS